MSTEPPRTASTTVYTARYLLYSTAGLLAAVLVGYAPVLANPFLSDDLNFRVFFRGAELDWARILGELWSGWGGLVGADYYRPLLTASVVVDYLAWGANPFGCHLTNVLLHTLNATLVAHIIMRIAGPGKRYPALLGALVFAVHPVHPEAVAWIAGRVDVLSALFFLLTVRCYLAYRWTGRRRHLIASLVALGLGLGSKESAVMAPAVLVALDLGLKLARGTPRWGLGARTAVLAPLALVAGYVVLRKLVLGSVAGSQDLLAPYASAGALVATLKQTSMKLFLLVAPANPAATGRTGAALFQGAVILMMLLPFLALLTHGKRTIPGPLLGGALILFPLALVSHILVDPDNLANSRVLYLPAAGFVVMLYSAPWDPRVRHELRRLGAAQMAVLSLLIAGAYFVMLRLNLRPWTEAGRIMNTLVREVDRVEADTPGHRKIVVKGLPDVHQGAYVARNGFVFALVRPFHHRDITRVFPVLDYFYGRDPGMLRAVHGDRTRIVLWDLARHRLLDLPPPQEATHQMSAEDGRAWADLAGGAWTPEPGLERQVHPDGGVTLVARREGAGLRGPVMRISPEALPALRFRQAGTAQLALGWSTAAEPDVFPTSPVMTFPPHAGERTVALVNHATWYLPAAPPVGRLRLSVWPQNTPLVLTDFTLVRRLPRLPLAIETEPLLPEPGAPLVLPLLRCPYTHFKIVILNPAAPHAVAIARPAEADTPLVVPAAGLAHLHTVAWALGGFEALLYVDAVEPDLNPLTTRARSRLFTVRFAGAVRPGRR
ncbi:MAG: hypothetical protein JXQ29_03830 [Planctomycetes bacterium]|nr:hypothetical protein [Planctomycetota bacterium]